MPESIRVLVVDDHAVVREGLRTFLVLQKGIEVVGEAGDGAAAVDEARRLTPDVVLMDLVMPTLDGVEAMRQIRAERPQARVIVLTSFGDDDEKLLSAVHVGAAGYLLKSAQPREIVRAIREAHAGRAVIDPKAAGRLLEALARTQPEAKTLTPREMEVLGWLCRGLPNKRIASELRLSEKTVKAHVGHIFGKLGVTDRTQAALVAVREGLTDC